MTRTVIALYDRLEDANAAVRELVDNNFSRERISIMANDQKSDYGRYATGEYKDQSVGISSASEGAGVGASIGATLGGVGGLLVGLGALTIPGIGPVIAAGPLAAAITGLTGAGAGALAGGVTGGLIGALIDSGVPEESAMHYSEGVRRGGVLVTISTDDLMSEQAVNIMNRHSPVDINTRVNEWRQAGGIGTGGESEIMGLDETEPIGTSEPVVDSGLETTEARYSEEKSIPTTGDYDRSFQGRDQSASNNKDASGVFGQDFSAVGREGALGAVDQPRRHDLGHDQEVSEIYHDSKYQQSGQFDRGTKERPHRDFTEYDVSFRNHFSTGMYGSIYDYDEFRPAYRYGYDLATDTRFADQAWEDIEPKAQLYWDEREPGAWDRFRDSVREAWQRVKGNIG